MVTHLHLCVNDADPGRFLVTYMEMQLRKPYYIWQKITSLPE